VEPSWPDHLPRAPLPDTITLGVRITTCEFGEDANIQTITPFKAVPHIIDVKMCFYFDI
jgi:hypothetical protein